MFKKIFVAVCLLACADAFAAPTCEVVDGKYVFTVPENETYTLTAEDVATMMSEDYVNYPLAKAGAGTLVVGAVMADYTNAIYILDGQYKATDRAAFGTTNGITYVDGGTVWSTRSAPTGDNNPATGSEAFHLKGTGYNNLGVIRQTDNDCYNFAAKGGITLDGGGSLLLAGDQTVAGDITIAAGAALVVTNSYAFSGKIAFGANAKL